MLDMGFLPDVRRILRHIPRPRQTLFFSATMPSAIEALTREILRTPATVSLQRRAAPAKGVTQALYPVPSALKGRLLVSLLKSGRVNEALVFTRTKHRADRLAKLLNLEGVAAERIHGNRSQGQRTKALAGFKAGDFQVLVATDIAARGIDIEALGHVVNFDVPAVPDDYIHRVGRTARAAATGEALTFVTPEDEDDVRRIERALGSKLERVRMPDFAYDAAGGSRAQIPSGPRSSPVRTKKAPAREPSSPTHGGLRPRSGQRGRRRP
jgi:ATP-dependent RNA helicase RhlE